MSTAETAAPDSKAAEDGFELEVRRRGSGSPPVLFLHGFEGPRLEQDYIEGLAREREVVAPIHPGYGVGERPVWVDSVSDLALLYLEFLEQHDLRDVVLVGPSLGGWIAAEMAVWRPERIGALILVDALGIRIGDTTDRDIADVYALDHEGRRELLYHDVTKAGPALDELSLEELELAMRGEDAMAFYTWEPYMCNPKLRRRLGTIQIPTLVVWGEEDGLVSTEYGRAYAEAIPGAELVTIPAAGHYPAVEQPERFLTTVERFLSDR